MEKHPHPKSGEHHARLQAIRDALLALHKTLVDSERAAYETTFGTIGSPNQFLKLLMDDPWFAWMHPMSQLIVAMDEALDEKKPLTVASADALAKQAANLLIASESGEGFARHYYDALQRDPDVIFAQATIAKLLHLPKPPEKA